MIKRLVSMEIQPDLLEEAEKILKENVHKIRSFKGCMHLQILRDINVPNRIFSYSEWNSLQDLENYRSSEFFRLFWKKLKKNFQTKAIAWTLESIPYLSE